MRVAVIGAGPAGLYAAIYLKQLRADLDIDVIEQNIEGATWGFGVVFSDQALGFLKSDDPDTAALIEPCMKRWPDIAVVHRGERIVIDGIGFAGIGRLELLTLLVERARALGVRLTFNRSVTSADEVEADLVIGADGLNSVVRSNSNFGEKIALTENRFAWYGANREFDALTQTFVETEHGCMTAHHYAYAPGMSTFIIEMPGDVFQRTGFAAMGAQGCRRECETLFRDTLAGASLIANNSVWRQFPDLTCENWFCGNRVLVGDALHTAHFSIGSGTRLAMEDVVALGKALQASEWDVPVALPAYQGARQPVLEKLVSASRASARWYGDFAEHMALDPWSFALSYIRRAGRLDAARLRNLAPKFAANVAERGIAID